jgi:PadR family transcriptional regulator PadR
MAPHMTLTTLLILGRLTTAPGGELYGLQIVNMTGLRSGTVYPILARLEERGLVESRREMIDPKTEGRPRRRFYQLTPAGTELARAYADRIGSTFTSWGVTP